MVTRTLERPAVTRPAAEPCAHCTLPVPAGRYDPGAEHQFCCSGCRTVYEVIRQSGFQTYYQLRGEQAGQPAEITESGFEELDDPTFVEHHCLPGPAGTFETQLHLQGVHCAACVWLVERALAREPGVHDARLSFARARLTLTFDPNTQHLSAIAQVLTRLGYIPHPLHTQQRSPILERRALLTRIGVAGAVAGNVMLMAFALYAGWFSGMEHTIEQFFRWASLLITLPSALYAAWPFYRSAWSGLTKGILHMDLPISLGILAGFLSGVVNTVRGTGEIYFDSVTALVFLLLIGRLLQQNQQRRAMERSEVLSALTPSAARKKTDAGTKRIPLQAIRPGDHLVIEAGEQIPTDGVIASGSSSVDLRLLSGESRPIPVGPEESVWGGTTNLESTIEIRATHSVEQARVGRIAEMVTEAAERRAPVVQLADRIAGWFVATVIFLAIVTFGVWSMMSPADAIDHTVALLIVCCPCALGLATPMAISAAIAKAARQGILVRSGAALEALGRLRTARFIFDKTGTLTEGRMDVVRFEGDTSVGPWVAAAERDQTHPVARALRRAFAAPTDLEATEVVPASGGITATVAGKRLHVGTPRFVADACQHTSIEDEATERYRQEGLSPVWIGVGGRAVATVGVADKLRPDAVRAVRILSKRGFDVEVLSGDDPAITKRVGARLGLDPARVRGGLEPEEKLTAVEAAARVGPVVMVGDGVNDAAALAAATVGISVHGGAEASLLASDVFLQRPGVNAVITVVQGARRTRRTLLLNIVFSLVYNVFGASIAMAGLLNPLVAAIVMPLSSLVVITHSLTFSFSPRGLRKER